MPLTDGEKSRYQWGGPHESPNIIEAQCVKAAAEYFGVRDWMAEWDPELTVDENIELMARRGSTPTMRELQQYR